MLWKVAEGSENVHRESQDHSKEAIFYLFRTRFSMEMSRVLSNHLSYGGDGVDLEDFEFLLLPLISSLNILIFEQGPGLSGHTNVSWL